MFKSNALLNFLFADDTTAKIKHEGVRYPCNKCEYAATTASSLKIHIEIKHEGVRYPCNKCEYATFSPSYLRNHIASVHKVHKVVCCT